MDLDEATRKTAAALAKEMIAATPSDEYSLQAWLHSQLAEVLSLPQGDMLVSSSSRWSQPTRDS